MGRVPLSFLRVGNLNKVNHFWIKKNMHTQSLVIITHKILIPVETDDGYRIPPSFGQLDQTFDVITKGFHELTVLLAQ